MHPLVRRVRGVTLVLCILLGVGAATRPLEEPAWKVVKAGQPEMNLAEIEGALGQGLVIGVLGGFRAILADFLWIRTNTVWERRDRPKLDAMIRLVTTLDPRPEFFWINAVRMTAYDVPNWRIREEGGYDAVSESRQRAINVEQAEQAFALLETAREFHPEEPKFYLEVAQIYLNRLKDDAKAAEWFLKAAEMPGAPYYAGRIYAELLRKQGKQEAAYEYLKKMFLEVPNDPYAQKSILLQRIREVEETLKIPVWNRFLPPEESNEDSPTEPPQRSHKRSLETPGAHRHDHDHAH